MYVKLKNHATAKNLTKGKAYKVIEIINSGFNVPIKNDYAKIIDDDGKEKIYMLSSFDIVEGAGDHD